MMVYVGLLYQDLVKRGEVLADGRLPPVLPIVLCNGARRWRAACDIAELIPPVPGLVERFKPRMRYLLIDENAYSDEALSPLRNLVAAVFRLEHPASPEAIGELLDLLALWLEDNPALRRTFAVWIRATLMRRKEYRIVLPQVEELQELTIMLSDRLEQWAKAYKAEGVELGVEKGMQKGEALMLRRVLVKRFGPLPAALDASLGEADAGQLERWIDRALDGRSLDKVFEEPGAGAH